MGNDIILCGDYNFSLFNITQLSNYVQNGETEHDTPN